MIRHVNQTVGQVLTESGARLAPFDRARVGRVGCVTAILVMAAAIGALAFGLRDAGGSLAAGFRFVVVSGLATVIVLFVIYAIVEGLVERRVRRTLELYISRSGGSLETLTRAAAMRREHIPGGERLVDLLEAIGRDSAQRPSGS